MSPLSSQKLGASDGPSWEPSRPSVVADACAVSAVERSPYEHDFYAWSMEQAEALREGRIADLDLPNLIDEVGGIARGEVRRLRRRLERLCHQMLLWDYGRLPRTRSRARTIALQRRRVAEVLKRCPSLDALKVEALKRGFDLGRYGALIEDDGLPEADLPVDNPYRWEDVMDRPIVGGDAG